MGVRERDNEFVYVLSLTGYLKKVYFKYVSFKERNISLWILLSVLRYDYIILIYIFDTLHLDNKY